MIPNATTQAVTLNDPLSSSEIKPPRKVTVTGRKNKVQKENVDISQGSVSQTVSLAHLPIQKQSTKIRKRVLVENETSANDQGTLKKHKIRIDDLSSPPTSSVLSALKVTPLHRALSDKSSHLNQASVHEPPTSALPKSQSTLSSWRRSSQSRKISSDGEDADDEEDDIPEPTSSALGPTAPTQSKSLSLKAPQAALRPGPIDKKLTLFEGEIFGSDSTLTSPEDDSDEEPRSERASTTSPSSAETTTTASLTAARATSTPISGCTSRRGPGRPRKPLQNNDTCQTSESGSDQSTSASNQDAVLALEAEITASSSSIKTKADLVSESEPQHAPLSRSFMERIINAQNIQATTVDQDQTSEDDVGLSDTQDHRSELSCLAPKPASSELSSDSTLSAGVKSFDSIFKRDDHLFAKPALPIRLDLESNRTRFPRRDSHASRTKPLDRAIPIVPLVANAGESRLSFRRTNRPRLFQTCRDIMTQVGTSKASPNIPHIKVMLKQALKRGMGAMQSISADSVDSTSKPTAIPASDPRVLGWGTVIGNGKGLFSPRRESDQLRIQHRRALVSQAYARLNLPPPRENWDISSQVIMGGLTYKNLTGATNADASGSRLSSTMEDAMDMISSRLGCQYCRKSCNSRTDLAQHIQQCSMARLQTTLGNDPDGDSTASETEDQRDARCPKTKRAVKATKTVRASSVILEHIASAAAAEDEAEGKEEGEGEEEEEEEEEAIIMCVCGTKDDEGAMVQCDKCEVWLHLECLELTEEEVPDEFFCPSCLGLPTRSTGGKSFRHVPSKNSRRKTNHNKSNGGQLMRDNCTVSDSENDADSARRFAERSLTPEHTRLRESETELEGEGSQMTDEDNDESAQESAVSPQVVLNHDWDQEVVDPTSDLGYDSEYMNSLYGMTSARAIFKKPRAPALMLDGSTSQESQMDAMAPLLSSDLGIDDFENLLSQGGHPPSMGLDLCSDGDLTFSESQSYQYMTGSDPIFEQDYGTALDSSPDLVLTSEGTLDSEGFRTPVHLGHDVDHVEIWNEHENDTDPFGTDYGAGSSMTAGSKRPKGVLVGTGMVDWYEDTAGDEFDLEGLIDLGEVSISD
ncbi:hypothetical protein BGZ83_005491 [Gryganskiella cystojenkinii]|nr:hypothetical protein BGZ83_005491 [Gryganskiella cystojenkinii]